MTSVIDALLDEDELYELQAYDHPQFGWYLTLHDEVAHEYDDAIDAMVTELCALEGVRSAVREDLEVVLISASLPRVDLDEWLSTWWRALA